MSLTPIHVDPLAEIARLREDNARKDAIIIDQGSKLKKKDALIGERDADIQRLRAENRRLHKRHIKVLQLYRKLEATYESLAARFKKSGLPSTTKFQNQKSLAKEHPELAEGLAEFAKQEQDFANEAKAFAEANEAYDDEKFAVSFNVLGVSDEEVKKDKDEEMEMQIA